MAGKARTRVGQQGGFTLIELIVATAIMVILTSMALPLARISIKREKERELRRDLWMMRDAIDRYKDAAERGGFQTKVGTEGYPPDLETLVKGIDSNGKKLKFLRRIPVDPMTGSANWTTDQEDSLMAVDQQEPGIVDVHSSSNQIASDGTAYSSW